tara:strand:- start:10843 stop:12822 length:1980 start_codon:yes stop_codon:yes gene_type:complete
MTTTIKYILFLILTIGLLTCKTSKEISDGSVAFDLKQYTLAKSLLNKEIPTAKESLKLKKILQLADSYKFSNEAGNAAKWYQKAIDLSGKNELYFDLAKMQKQSENFEKAIASFLKYKELTFDEYRAVPEISICQKILKEQAKLNNMRVQNLEKINSSKSDFSATIYKNGNLIISSTRKQATGSDIHPWNGEKNSDLFLVDLKNNLVEKYDTILNTSFPEANITFNSDFSIAYFTRCDFTNNIAENGYCHIFKTEKDGEEWFPAEKIALFPDSINIGQPFLTKDGKRLYFSADWKDGYGGNDIYYVNIKDGEYGFPINAGFHVNTKEDELFPTLDSKGNLYFSTSGRTGFGGLDIFKSIPENKGYATAEQMSYPINSGADDFYLVYTKEFDGQETNGLIEEAFFSSTRKGGKGNDDIYLYKKELLNNFRLELFAQEKTYKTPEDDASEFLGIEALKDAEIKLITLSSTAENVEISNENGLAFFDLAVETDYKILVSKKDYFNQSILISTKNLQDVNSIEIVLKDTVELAKIFPDKEIVIKNIYYDLDKAALRTESLPELDKLINFFEENNDLTIEIGSHTDSRGSDGYNLELSQRRAQSVVNYLVSKGIPPRQLIAKGYGETKILNSCFNDIECSEEAHQANRRTSFKVISTKGILESD